MGLGPHDPWCSWTRRWRPQVERERSAAAAMLGLPGFVVLAVSDYAGEVEQAIETTVDVVGCPECGAVAQLHDRRPCWVRDLPAGAAGYGFRNFDNYQLRLLLHCASIRTLSAPPRSEVD